MRDANYDSTRNAARRKTETGPANKPSERPIPLLSPRVIATSSWLLQDDGRRRVRYPVQCLVLDITLRINTVSNAGDIYYLQLILSLGT